MAIIAGQNGLASEVRKLIPPYMFTSQMTATENFGFLLNNYSDVNQLAVAQANGTDLIYFNNMSTVAGCTQVRAVTSDWASATTINAQITLGVFVYVLLRDASNNYRIYRYGINSLSSGGTLMTISGQAFATTGGGSVVMSTNGTDILLNFKAGNNASDRIVSRYTLSGTTLTYVSDITCGASSNVANLLLYIDSSNTIYGFDPTTRIVRKYNSSGVLQSTTTAYPFPDLIGYVYSFFDANYLAFSGKPDGGGSRPFYFHRVFIQ